MIQLQNQNRGVSLKSCPSNRQSSQDKRNDVTIVLPKSNVLTDYVSVVVCIFSPNSPFLRTPNSRNGQNGSRTVWCRSHHYNASNSSPNLNETNGVWEPMHGQLCSGGSLQQIPRGVESNGRLPSTWFPDGQILLSKQATPNCSKGHYWKSGRVEREVHWIKNWMPSSPSNAN